MLLTFGVDDVIAQASASYERRINRNITGSLEKLPCCQMCEDKSGFKAIEVILTETVPRCEIGPQNREDGRRD